jgi:hypothetical protein
VLGRLIVLIVLLIAVTIIVQRLKKTPKSQLKSLYIKLGLSTGAILLILLAATGRIHWVGALIGAAFAITRTALPLLIRYFPILQQFHRKHTHNTTSASGNSSEVITRTLKMSLDHDTQTLQGEVIDGLFAGSTLEQLELTQLQQLLDYCQQQDQESVKLLLSYLNHRFGNSWQTHQPPTNRSGELSIDDALAILGLQQGASKEQIIQAHRRMMQKVHPDRGGSDYLAAQINLAKDLLLSNYP